MCSLRSTIPTVHASLESSAPPSPGGYEHVEGRNERRGRNTAAVLDATMRLLVDGVTAPTTKQISESAAVSQRSIFRYFHDVDELITAAVLAQIECFGSYISFDPPPQSAPIDERNDYLVQHRLRQYEAVGPALRAATVRSAQIPTLREILTDIRSNARAQLDALFAPELEGLDEILRPALVGAIHNVILFEGYDNLVERHGMGPAQIGGVYRMALRRLLSPA